MSFFLGFLYRLTAPAFLIFTLLVLLGLPTPYAALLGFALIDLGAIYYLGRSAPKPKRPARTRLRPVPHFLN